MNLAPVRAHIHPSLWPAILVFFALAVVPIVEMRSGNYPGSHQKESPSSDKILNGQLAESIAKDLSDHSVCASAVRPYYNEGLYLLFRRVNRDVTLGKDHWLFLSPPKFRFSDAERLRLIDRYSKAFISVSKSLREMGTELVWAVVPYKTAIHPEKLPDDFPAPPVLWPAIEQQLKDAGVAVFPVKEAIRKQPYPQYISDDSHWTQPTAQGVWKELAEWIKQRGVPLEGLSASGSIELREARSLRQGDLLSLLGFRPSGALDRRFSTRQMYLALSVVSEAAVGTQCPTILLGTSYSLHYRAADSLSVHLGIRVEDGAKPAAHPHDLMRTFLKELAEGKRLPPKLVIFEFPERYLEGLWYRFITDFERFSADLTASSAWFDTPVDALLEQAYGIEDFVASSPSEYSGRSVKEGAGLIFMPKGPEPRTSYMITFKVEHAETLPFVSVAAAYKGSLLDQTTVTRVAGEVGDGVARLIVRSGSEQPITKLYVRPSNQLGAFKISEFKILAPR